MDSLSFETIIAKYAYPIVITFIFLTIYISTRLKLQAESSRRLRRLSRRDISDAVTTDSPIDDQQKDLKEQGKQGLASRFGFINKAWPLALFFSWLLLVSIPYIGKIPTAYVSLVAAVVSVIVGISFRPFLDNLFAGVIVSFFKSLKVGDAVEIDQQYGLIEDIGLTHTILKRWDWMRVVIPNAKLLQKEIYSYNMNDTFMWAHIEFYVHPTADLEEVKELAIESAKHAKNFMGAEDPSFWVMGIDREAIRCWVAAWADAPDKAWELRHEMRMLVMQALRAKGIATHAHYTESILPVVKNSEKTSPVE